MSIGLRYHPSLSCLLQGDKRIVLGKFNAFVNYNKAHTSWLTNLVDESLRNLPQPSSGRKDDKILRTLILDAALSQQSEFQILDKIFHFRLHV